ncbi:TRAP transporter substrate-binding protein [Halomonas sp. KM-1]|uniref:TRAP transporter substrate-binding protein n=1 Tax=Halomonas sp. KM-1 TaxID=590061 RepID=UPI0002890CD0|nr:TRAP transporter substrate-binding protein [Halomonas sp. KM-1]
MKLLQKLALAGALLALTTTAWSSEIKVALDSPPDLEKSGSYVWAHHFTEALNERGLRARELPRDAVGGEAEKLDQIAMGLLEVSLSDVNSVARIDPFIFGVRLPYLFDGVAHMDRALAEGDVLNRINDDIAHASVRLLAIVPLGPPSGIITTRKAVTTPDDMSGLRMRALDDAQIALYRAWGSNGTIVSWGEVPAALQTGIVDGYINTPLVPIMFGQTDIVGHFTDANVMNALRAVLVSDDWYRGLSDDERAIVDESVDVANQANRAWLEEVTPKALAELEVAGVEVLTLTDAARERFRELSQPVYHDTTLTAEQVETWSELAQRTR